MLIIIFSMTTLNKSMFLVKCSVCLATLIKLQGLVLCFDGGSIDSSFSEMVQQLNRRFQEGSKLLSAENSSSDCQIVGKASNNSITWKAIDGFFRTYHRRADRNNKKYSDQRRNGSEKIASDVFDDSITTSSVNLTTTLFATENECTLANNERPCVCYMTEFLYSVYRQLDEETVTSNDDSSVKVLTCPSYKVVPAEFVISPMLESKAATTTTVTGVHVLGQCAEEYNFDNITPTWKHVNFNDIINYQLEKPKSENYAVHYTMVGSDIKVRCVIDGESNTDVGKNTFIWDYKKDKHKSNSTVTGTDTSQLLILGLESYDSKNYTCVLAKEVDGKLKNGSSFTHYVIAVDKPNYEIRGIAIYKTNNVDGCTHDVIIPIKKQLPDFVKTEICPEGPLHYACNVVVETLKCFEDKRTLEINYMVTLNNQDTNHLTRIKIGKIGRSALNYHKTLARISNEIAGNLNKILTVQIMFNISSSNMNFKPVQGGMNITVYVSCASGFGMREVFCGVCPPHYFSPEKYVECLKCPKGFHQPISGSAKCVKCPNLFANGCYMTDVSSVWYYLTGFICLMICSIIVLSCLCCCREENETNIRIIPRKIRAKFKSTKEYNFFLNKEKNTKISGSKWDKLKTIKKGIKFNKNPKNKIIDSTTNSDILQNTVGQYIPKTDVYHVQNN